MLAPSDNVEVSPEESDNSWRWRAIRSLHAKMVQAAVEPNLQTLCIVLEVCPFLLFGSDPAATVTAVQAHRNEGSDHSRLVDEILSKADDVSVVLAPRLLAALGPIAALPRPTDSAIGRWIQMAADLAARSDRDRFRHGAVLVAADGSTVRGADPLRCVHPAVTTVRAPHRVHAGYVPSSQRTMFWHPGVIARTVQLLSSGFNHNYCTGANKHKAREYQLWARGNRRIAMRSAGDACRGARAGDAQGCMG